MNLGIYLNHGINYDNYTIKSLRLLVHSHPPGARHGHSWLVSWHFVGLIIVIVLLTDLLLSDGISIALSEKSRIVIEIEACVKRIIKLTGLHLNGPMA